MEDVLERGIANIIPGKSELIKTLQSEKKLNIYLGIDPTATQIHLGHAVSLRLLQQFASHGHNVTFLIGNFTALIGDSSDKESERPKLSRQEIEKNFKSYKEQAEKLLDFSKIQIKYNSEWNNKLNFEDLLKLSGIFSLNDFISRELIKKRLQSGKRIGLSETFYPLIQAYDAYTLKTDIQIGGTDQTFNMQAGRNLIKQLEGRESFVITTEFLMGTDGRKMSKSWGNAIWLTDEPFEMYRKVMAINDDQIKNYFLLATNINVDNIPSDDEIKNNPVEVKKRLASQIVSELHSEEDARSANLRFEKEVQAGEAPTDLPKLKVNKGDRVDPEFLFNNKLAHSKSDAKRLFEQNGVSIDDEKIQSGFQIKENVVLRIGKKMVKLNLANG